MIPLLSFSVPSIAYSLCGLTKMLWAVCGRGDKTHILWTQTGLKEHFSIQGKGSRHWGVERMLQKFTFAVKFGTSTLDNICVQATKCNMWLAQICWIVSWLCRRCSAGTWQEDGTDGIQRVRRSTNIKYNQTKADSHSHQAQTQFPKIRDIFI